jgi:hypothetical protein
VNSFGLLKTNVLLTSNVKVVIDSLSNIYLESIESDSYLSLNKLKKYKYNYNISFGKNLSLFYKDLPNDIIFRLKKNELSLVFDDYNYQSDNLYNYGALNISNNKDYEEKYEYFAPLYIRDKIPSNFLIFRVDGLEYDNISNTEFKSKIIENFKLVKNINLFDDKIKSLFNSDFYKYYPLEINLSSNDFSYFYGIDIKTGISTKKSFNLYKNLIDEKEIYELEKLITYKYSDLGLIYPKIINLSFLFNDYPSTPDSLKDWSINRYFGFYVDDIIKIDSITTYNAKKIKNNVTINKNNYLISPDGYPFIEKWDETKPFYVEYNGLLYLVKKITLNNTISLNNVNKGDYINQEYIYKTDDFYQIICDINLEGKQNMLNAKIVTISSEGYISKLDNTPYSIEDNSYDVSIIEIDSIYYSLILKDGYLKINSDYAFDFNDLYYRLKSAGNWIKKDIKVDFNNKPLSFNIFKVKFSDVKYFDNRIINTDIANFEYDIKDKIVNTQEPKLYLEDYSDNSIPKPLNELKYNSDVIYVPTCSEYTANLETFKIDNDKLSNIWQPNSDYCRWGYINSISSFDYPYVFNNSFIMEDFNRTVDLNTSIPNRIERNLDYFYTINTQKNKYTFNSLDINKTNFNLEQYISSNEDYFTNFFEGVETYDSDKLKKYKKYSIILRSDNIVTNQTLFRGIKFNIFKFSKNNELAPTNDLVDYKLSILLSRKKISNINWNIIREWKLNNVYKNGDKVIFNDIIYVCNNDTIQSNPTIFKNDIELKASPYNLNDWIPISEKTILWSPSSSIIYELNDVVYNNGNYYVLKNENSNIDFWNPYKEYNLDDIVIFKGNKYKSLISNNIFSPDQGFIMSNFGSSENKGKYWTIDNGYDITKWLEIQVWAPDKKYTENEYIYFNEIVYKSKKDIGINQSPDINNLWERYYSLIPQNNFVYKQNNNRVLIINNHYYYLVSNLNNETLDNGIEIYINKKFKNILILINNSDNTLPYTLNIERDIMYDMIYKNITAFNFVNIINNWNNNFGFINKLKYTIIDNDGLITYDHTSTSILDNNYLLLVDFPNKIEMNPNSIFKKVYNKIPNFNIKNKLIDNRLDSLKKIEWYSNIPLAYNIGLPKENINDLNPNIIYRYVGYYEPIMLDVDLFDTNNLKFNTNLYNFGLIKERKLIKVSKDQMVLKLSNSVNYTSIYPMIDEFGILALDWNIFKSTYSDSYIYVSKK